MVRALLDGCNGKRSPSLGQAMPDTTPFTENFSGFSPRSLRKQVWYARHAPEMPCCRPHVHAKHWASSWQSLLHSAAAEMLRRKVKASPVQ